MSTTHQQYMTQTDFMSWRMEEDPILRSTIVAVALLDRSPDQSRFVDMMRRAVDLVPLFRRAAIEAPMGLAPPRWADDRISISAGTCAATPFPNPEHGTGFSTSPGPPR